MSLVDSDGEERPIIARRVPRRRSVSRKERIHFVLHEKKLLAEPSNFNA
jgi:hypothetical protein